MGRRGWEEGVGEGEGGGGVSVYRFVIDTQPVGPPGTSRPFIEVNSFSGAGTGAGDCMTRS